MNTQVTLTLSEPIYHQVQTMAEQSDRTIADILTEIITLSVNQKTTGESILEMIANFTDDLSQSEIDKLPTDAAEKHDFYIYRNS
jgi:hypothetical protein